MKKISMFFMATAMMAFVACGGGEKKGGSEEAAVVEETVVEETPAASTSSSSSDVVAKYQELCDKMVELAPKVKSGDMNAVQEYQKIVEEFSNFAQNNADAWSNLSVEDAQKIQEIAQKATDAMMQ